MRVSEAAVASPSPASILVVYFAKEHPLRETIDHSLYAFERHTPHRCVYLNLAVRRVPREILRETFDLVVFHTTFLSVRWNPPAFERLLERAAPLRRLGRARAALPQDEFIHTDLLQRFIESFEITHLFTAASPREWERIYPDVDPAATQMHQVLTGYLDPAWVRKVADHDSRRLDRPIDIGYRAKSVPYWLGTHGRLKVSIADAVCEKACKFHVATDISVRPEDTLFGGDWTRFLLNCKYVLGVEGGASILDTDGSLRSRVEAFLAEHPRADYEIVRRTCFADQDETFRLRAISPRHLEACATCTAQLLVVGEYNGILRPNEHYIPIKQDFSNLDAVLRRVEEDAERAAIVERCLQDIVLSGRYGADRFALGMVEMCLGPDLPRHGAGVPPVRVASARCRDQRSWLLVRLRQRTVSVLRKTGLDRPLRTALGRGR